VGDVAGMGSRFIWFLCCDRLAAMVLVIMLSKICGNIQDTFGGIGPFFVPMAIAGFGILFSIIGTMVVKITDDNAKAQVQKRVKYRELAFNRINSCCLLFFSTIHVAKKRKWISLAKGLKISSMRVFLCYDCWFSSWSFISSVTNVTRLGTKPLCIAMAETSTGTGTNVIAGLATGNDFVLTVLLFAAAIWASYALAGFYGVALAAGDDGNNSSAAVLGPISDNAGGIAEMSLERSTYQNRYLIQ
jgi:K(+)-stimulated pyrophosphate-energized sodium pump